MILLTFGQKISKLMAAIQLVSQKQRNCYRADKKKTPAITHVVDVACKLWFVGGIRDLDVIIASLLHDIIEDTDISYSDLKDKFGKNISEMVLAVTLDQKLKPEEKHLQAKIKIRQATAGAKLVRLGDIISNCEDMIVNPPQWKSVWIDNYFERNKIIIDSYMHDLNPGLTKLFHSLYDEHFNKKQDGKEKHEENTLENKACTKIAKPLDK